MKDTWQYQIRLRVTEALAERLRDRPDAPEDAPLRAVLDRHGAVIKSQYQAFADYVAEAEREGVAQYPLYRWTRDTIEDPAKEAKYRRVYTAYVNGQEVYDGAVAEALRQELAALGTEGGIEGVTKVDTNPANNPQPPPGKR
ncbi:hypothetical protein CAL29_24970 [Bordetella genomosp. 10]|uniref:Uncharacterized protein n=1 Tax=Bordetella genomosp. 10 TaxID=1416804 RepID=A0A261S1H6_9BORD|nr:hypothetical protein [Bordetella genomosp. 10]OZI31186.1 hypothetical protein CAL29_24970 [Bordetella genomosp. 10]